MCKFLGEREISACLLPVVVTLILIIFPPFLQAQTPDCYIPDYGDWNEFSTISAISPNVWNPGQTYTVTIYGSWEPVTPAGCTSDQVTVYANSSYPYPLTNGIDPNVTVSNVTYVDAATTTFQVTIAANAPTQEDAVNIECHGAGCGNFNDQRIGVYIQPPLPPPPPCPTPSISSISPTTWLAGKTYSGVTVTGVGFITSSAATANCPASTVTLSSGSQKVTLSNVNVVSETTITVTVKSMADDRTELATVTVSGTPAASITAQVTGCQLPTSETTTFDGWSSATPTQGMWKQTIAGTSSISFSGVLVSEVPGGTGTDNCHFAGSPFDPYTSISYGQWPVTSTNAWRDDYVGWFPDAVTYYRAQRRAPCGATFYQQMAMACLNDDGTYSYRNYGSVNTLGANITQTTVTSKRAGKTQTRSY